jgi:hypothetical protein
MQGTVVMLIALSGLGCQNKPCGALPGTLTSYGSGDWSAANGYSNAVAQPGYPAYVARPDSGYDHSGYPGGALRSTLWSFVLGRDPDVPTAREIEATFNSGGYDQIHSLPSARRPPSE